MNKQLMQPINEITDSVEMLYEKPSKGMSMFSWLLLLILAAVIAWCCIGDIDYYVKAAGTVRPTENISSISSLMSGKVTELNITEGTSVKKGDLLFKVDTTDLEQAYNAYQKEKARINLDIGNLQKLETSINTGENLFNVSNTDENNYYYKYEKYISDLNSLSEQYQNKDVDTNRTINDTLLSVNSIKEQIVVYETELDELNTLKLSVEKNKNLFKESSSVYAQKFQTYIAAVEVYNHAISTQKDTVKKAESSYDAGEISKNDYDTVCAELKSSELEFEKYRTDFMLSVEQNIDNINKSINDLNTSLTSKNQDYKSISQINYDSKLASDNLTLEMLTSISDQIKSLQTSIDAIDKEISSIQLSMQNAEVSAPIDGIINMYANLNNSDLIQSGQTVATILPNSEGTFKLTMYIAEKDIQDIEIGQVVNLRFSALPYQEYGEFLGTVKSISTDARNNENGISYYVAEVTIEDTNGYDLVSGMECEARVITKQRKIIYWLLEKLNFID